MNPEKRPNLPEAADRPGAARRAEVADRPGAARQAEATDRSGAARWALIGRRIGIGLFWFMAVYVIVASTSSVVAELFDFPSAPAQDAEAPRCAAEIRSLHDSLLEHASAQLKQPRDRVGLRRWLADWDKQFAETREPCGSLKDTRRSLLALRERVEALLHDYARDALPLSERIERALERYTPRSSGLSHHPSRDLT
jgi:hypothetical protein